MPGDLREGSKGALEAERYHRPQCDQGEEEKEERQGKIPRNHGNKQKE